MEENVDIEIEMDLPNEQEILSRVTLFIRKLWKMVNDKDAEHIIRWNRTGDGIIILDQFEFIKKLLPRYFKHNKMSSFIRQLNTYNFHKVPTVNEEMEFAHSCFVKEVPELLVFIRRKTSAVKPKEISKNEELKDYLDEIQELRNKNFVINKEMILLKQKNMTLWSELSSLRMKYEKQSSVMNKLINFLISYIHKHQTSYTNHNVGVPSRSNQTSIESSPKIIELDYRDKRKILDSKTDKIPCTKFQPGSSNSHGTITYSVKLPESLSKTTRKMPSLQEILSHNHGHSDRLRFPLKHDRNSHNGITYSIEFPTDQSEKIIPTDIQESLFELLKENERLFTEDPEIFTDINTVDKPVESVQYGKPVIEFEPAFSNLAGNSYYTVSYPKDEIQNIKFKNHTPVITSLQSPPVISPDAPTNTIEMNNNISMKPGSTQLGNVPEAGLNFIFPSPNETKSQSNIFTSAKMQNYIHSQKLLESSSRGASLKRSKIPKAKPIERGECLLEILKETESLSCDNPQGMSEESEFFLHKNVDSIVEAPDSNLEFSETLSDNLEAILEIVEPTVIEDSISPGTSKAFNIIENPASYIRNSAIKNKPSLHGNRQQKLGNTKLQLNNKVSPTAVRHNFYSGKQLKSTDTEATTNTKSLDIFQSEKRENSNLGESFDDNKSIANNQQMRNIQLMSQENEKPNFPIVEMLSGAGPECILQVPDLELDGIECTGCPNEVQPIVQDTVHRNSIAPPSLGPKKMLRPSDSLSNRKSQMNSRKQFKAVSKSLRNKSAKTKDFKMKKPLLAFLKEESSLSNEIPGKIPPVIVRDANMNAAIDTMEFAEILDNDLHKMPDMLEPMENSALNPNEFDLLGNTSSYTNASHDDLNILQEFIDSLDSKDINDILSNDCNMAVDNLSYVDEGNPTDVNVDSCQGNSNAQVKGTASSVDTYFNPHFFYQNSQ